MDSIAGRRADYLKRGRPESVARRLRGRPARSRARGWLSPPLASDVASARRTRRRRSWSSV